MARRRKKQNSEQSTDRIISKDVFSSLMKEVSAHRADISELSGLIGSRIKLAADNNNLHRGAFALMVRLKRMDEVKRNDFLRHVELYSDICTELGFFGAQTKDMFEDGGDAEDESETETSETSTESTPEADAEPDIRPPFMKRDIDAEAAAQNAALLKDGIKQLQEPDAEKPKRGRKKAALEGTDAEGSYTSVN